MSSSSGPVAPFKVVIAGGGVAALEAVLGLREFGPGHFEITLLAPDEEFAYRPMTVREPFAYSAAERHDLGAIAADLGVELLAERFASVDPQARIAHLESGAEVRYDALLLALGARPHARFPHALTIDDSQLDELMHGLLEDIDGGYVHTLAFVVPQRGAWPLPIYELALMTSARAFDMNVALAITIVTPEATPLEVFGDAASAGVAELLAGAGISVVGSASCEVPDSRHVVINPGDRTIAVDRIVALPELFGPAVRGLRSDEHGFIPIDEHCKVEGADRVYAAGDATAFPIKHGGIAAQQADAAAAAIAALAGVGAEPEPLHPLIQGILLTGGAPVYLSARLTGGRGLHSELGESASWTPPAKIAARHLAPYLSARSQPGG